MDDFKEIEIEKKPYNGIEVITSNPSKPLKSYSPQIDSSEQDEIDNLFGLFLSPIDETCFIGLSELLPRFESPIFRRKFITEKHVVRILKLLDNDDALAGALQALSFLLSNRKFDDIILNESANLFYDLNDILNKTANHLVVEQVFFLLTSLIKRKISFRNVAYDEGIYDNLERYHFHEESYFDNFASFLQYSVYGTNYPPDFLSKIASSIYYLISTEQEEYIKCALTSISKASENEEQSIDFFSNFNIVKALNFIVETQNNPEFRCQCIDFLSRGTTFGDTCIELLIQYNVIDTIGGCIDGVISDWETDDQLLFLESLINFTDMFATHTESYFVNIVPLYQIIPLDFIFEQAQFQQKKKCIHCMRVFASLANFEQMGNELINYVSPILELLEENEVFISYDILGLFNYCLQMFDSESKEHLKEAISSEDIFDLVEDLIGSSDADLADAAKTFKILFTGEQFEEEQ